VLLLTGNSACRGRGWASWADFLGSSDGGARGSVWDDGACGTCDARPVVYGRVEAGGHGWKELMCAKCGSEALAAARRAHGARSASPVGMAMEDVKEEEEEDAGAGGPGAAGGGGSSSEPDTRGAVQQSVDSDTVDVRAFAAAAAEAAAATAKPLARVRADEDEHAAGLRDGAREAGGGGGGRGGGDLDARAAGLRDVVSGTERGQRERGEREGGMRGLMCGCLAAERERKGERERESARARLLYGVTLPRHMSLHSEKNFDVDVVVALGAGAGAAPAPAASADPAAHTAWTTSILPGMYPPPHMTPYNSSIKMHRAPAPAARERRLTKGGAGAPLMNKFVSARERRLTKGGAGAEVGIVALHRRCRKCPQWACFGPRQQPPLGSRSRASLPSLSHLSSSPSPSSSASHDSVVEDGNVEGAGGEGEGGKGGRGGGE